MWPAGHIYEWLTCSVGEGWGWRGGAPVEPCGSGGVPVQSKEWRGVFLEEVGRAHGCTKVRQLWNSQYQFQLS